MNYFLFINRRLLILLGFIIIVSFVIFIFAKQILINNIKFENIEEKLSNIDISEPRFSIKSASRKIYITAKEGNFLNKNEILLNQNVRFKSNDFSIETQKVIFDRNKQTAKSESESLFTGKNISISSEGFDIHDRGNKITFFGSSLVILK